MAFTPTEKGVLLEILTLTGEAGTSERAEFDSKVEAAEDAEASDGRETRVRSYITEWGRISTKPATMTGEIEYQTERHKYAVYAKTAKALGYDVMTYAEYVELIEGSAAEGDSAQLVVMNIGGMFGSESEY